VIANNLPVFPTKNTISPLRSQLSLALLIEVISAFYLAIKLKKLLNIIAGM